jgi:hypothetical protein
MNTFVTKKFQFGAGFGEIINEELAIQQMRARNFLRNELVAIDRQTREKYYAIVNADNPAQDSITEAFAKIAELRDELLMLRVPPATRAILRLEAVAIRTDKAAVKNLTGAEKKAVLAELKKRTDSLKKNMESSREQSEAEVKEQKDALKREIDTLKETITDLKPVARAKQQENKENNSEALDKLNTERKTTISALRTRAIAGYTHVRTTDNGEVFSVEVPALYNLNAGEIVDQHETERSRAMKDKTELRFHRFNGEGRSFVSVHLPSCNDAEFKKMCEEIRNLRQQKKNAKKNSPEAKALGSAIQELEDTLAEKFHRTPGLSEEEVFSGTATQFRIDAVNLQRDVNNPTVWEKSVDRAQRRRAMRTVAHIRIQSAEKGKPVFLSIPILMHRPFPAGARMLSAAVNREKIGMKWRWNVEFTVLFNEIGLPSNNGTVAIDLGWAKDSLPDANGRVRVAGVRERTEDGQETFTEFCLPVSFTEYAKKLEDIHSIRDKHTNEAFEKIAAFRAVYEIRDETLRNLLDKAKASLTARKGKTPPVGHLRSAAWMLRNGKAEAQVELKDILELWYERWNHLNEWLGNGETTNSHLKRTTTVVSLILWRSVTILCSSMPTTLRRWRRRRLQSTTKSLPKVKFGFWRLQERCGRHWKPASQRKKESESCGLVWRPPRRARSVGSPMKGSDCLEHSPATIADTAMTASPMRRQTC